MDIDTEHDTEQIKTIIYTSKDAFDTHRQKKYLEKKKKVVTHTKRWATAFDCEDDFTIEQQYKYLEFLSAVCMTEQIDNAICEFTDRKKYELILSLLRNKLAGYKSQDCIKGLFDGDRFIDLSYVLQLLIDSKLVCHYCSKPTYIIYEIVREMNQWTIDRIDNSIGHVRGNVVNACLLCNLNRKTIKSEKYLFTKQLAIIKVENDESVSTEPNVLSS